MEPRDRLRVDDLAAPDHRECLEERPARDLRDHLVRLVALVGVDEAAGEEEVDALVAEPGRREDRPEVAELARVEARLLAQLARGAALGGLARRVEDTGGQLPDVPPRPVPGLAEGDHPVLVVDPDPRRRAPRGPQPPGAPPPRPGRGPPP